MAIRLSPASLTRYVLEQLEHVELGSGPERRLGAVALGANCLRMIRRDMRGIGRLIEAERLTQTDALSQVDDLTLELASLLYSSGAPHEVWRRWSGTYALGTSLLRRAQEAAKFAALGGEWALLSTLPPERAASKRVSERVVWALLIQESLDPTSVRAADAEDDAWLSLATSIPGGDHSATDKALKTIAQHWMAEGDWQTFHPRSAPDFEPSVCAAAALARRGGYRPENLSVDELQFLEPGLAEPEPTPLWPEVFVDSTQPERANGTVHNQRCHSS